VNEQSHAVPEAVAEVLAVPGVGDHGSRGRVRIAPGGAGPHHVEPRLLRLADDLVRLAQRVRDLAHSERPRAVRAVAGEQRAGVNQDELAFLHDPVARHRVRARGGRTPRDVHGERQPVAAEVVEELLHPPGELLLRSARKRLLD
jgi:hypothetical protein